MSELQRRVFDQFPILRLSELDWATKARVHAVNELNRVLKLRMRALQEGMQDPFFFKLPACLRTMP